MIKSSDRKKSRFESKIKVLIVILKQNKVLEIVQKLLKNKFHTLCVSLNKF